MKNKAVITGLVLSLCMSLTAMNSFAAEKTKDIVGTWSYEAPSADYQYRKGQLIFSENDSKLEGKIKIGQSEIDMRNIKLEGETISFGAYIEGEYISVKITLKKNTFSGKANYSEGSTDLSGKKE
jgi:hypothetical protein